MRFADKLAMLIDLRGTTQTRLGRDTGLGQSAISAMARGEQRPYVDQAMLLARALGVSLDYLADDARSDSPAGAADVDRLVSEAVRALGPEEAWRRLLGRPIPEARYGHQMAVDATPDATTHGEAGNRRKGAG